MNSHWQQQLLALVMRYGDQCGQLGAERATGISEHPPADRAAAWAAIISHLAQASHSADARMPVETA